MNRVGVVLVSAVEGRDLAALLVKVAEASRAVYAELLEHRDAAASKEGLANPGRRGIVGR